MDIRTLGYITQEIPSAISSEKRLWRGAVQSAGVVPTKSFVGQVANRANIQSEVVEHILKCEMNTKVKLLREGYQVNVVDTSYYPVIAGAFARPDSGFTPGVNRIEVVAVPRGEFRNCLADVKPVNLVRPPAPTIQSVMDLVTGAEWTLTQGNAIGVAGRNLAPDSSREDEKVWLEKDGEKVTEGTIVSSDLQIVNVTLSLWPTPGEYDLCLATRSGLPAEYTLVTVKKAVTVVAPQNVNA